MTEYQFDALDRRIIKELSLNARMAFSALAEKLKVSNSLIHQRIKKLEETGVLIRPIYQLDPEVLGYESSAYVQIMISHVKFIHEIIGQLKKIPEITECSNVAGRYAIVAQIHARNNTHLRNIIYERIQSIKGVEGTNSIILFETSFRRPINVDMV